MLARLAQASGIATPTAEDLIRLDRRRYDTVRLRRWTRSRRGRRS
jgi:hypothetical protein